MTMPSILSDQLADFTKTFSGRLIDPAHPDYERARAVMNGMIDSRPAAIARPRTPEDVAHAIGLARKAGLPLAVRGGGHSSAGHGTSEGGIVIDMRDMKGIELDADAGTVWAGAGATAGEVLAAVCERGFVIGFGDAASVGIAGITLGGGIGYLVRKHGLTIDSLLAVEIVLADGRVLMVDADHEPDLFWALRGGGGNFGVVTRLRYRLAPLPAFTGGMMILPATEDTITGFVAAAVAAPDALSTIAMVMPAPPMPFLAAEHHGQPIIMGMMAFAGPDADAPAALAPFRALATPLADMVKPGPFMQMYPPEDADYRPKAIARTFYADGIDRAAARALLDAIDAGTAPLRGAQLRVLGGAEARVPADATAYAHRGQRLLGIAVAFVGDEPGDAQVQDQWVNALCKRLATGAGAYVNFLGEEGQARIREAYPQPTWTRLQQVKRRYDPDNVFQRNQNVPPA